MSNEICILLVLLAVIGFTILATLLKLEKLLEKIVSYSLPEVTRELTKEACEKLGGSVKDGRCIVIAKGALGGRVVNIGEIVDEVKT